MPESNIGFYGHVKQYHNLKAEIDQAILEVLESGSYVLGPQLVKFEEELARYMKTKEAVGVNSGTDALVAGVSGAWPRARRRDHHHLQHFFRHGGSHLAGRRHSGVRGLRSPRPATSM